MAFLPEWLRRLWDPPPARLSEELEQLKADWLADNSDAREEGIFLDEYNRRTRAVEERQKADPLDPKKLLELAEAYAIVDPKDKRVLSIGEQLVRFGDLFFDKQRQGDTYQLYGRSLFLANRFQESLEYLLKAHACFREKGNRKVRRHNNVGLLRAYSALGQSKPAAERLEVALTQCEEKDDSIMLYMHAKNALEKTGVPRDAEVLDDIWYVYLDMHDEVKRTWESYQGVGKNLVGQLAGPGDGSESEKTLGQALRDAWPSLKRDLSKSTAFRALLVIFSALLLVTLMLVMASKVAGK